jgi:hypothetical protein
MISHTIHQAERTRTWAEQREADVRTSELVAGLAGLSHSLTECLGALRRLAQHGRDRWAAEQAAPPAEGGQLLGELGLPAPD